MAQQEGMNYTGYNSFCGVTHSTIEYIADAKVFSRGKQIKLREDNGTPIVSACMYLLGFERDRNPNVLLRPVEGIALKDENLSQLLTRCPTSPSYAEYSKIYTGKLREEYHPSEELHSFMRNIHFEGDVMCVVGDAMKRVSVDQFGSDC